MNDATVHVLAHWGGLRGRRLGEYLSGWREGPDTPPARQNDAHAFLSSAANAIPDELPDLVQKVTRPLYEAFSVHGTGRDVIAQELARMAKRSG